MLKATVNSTAMSAPAPRSLDLQRRGRRELAKVFKLLGSPPLLEKGAQVGWDSGFSGTVALHTGASLPLQFVSQSLVESSLVPGKGNWGLLVCLWT